MTLAMGVTCSLLSHQRLAHRVAAPGTEKVSSMVQPAFIWMKMVLPACAKEITFSWGMTRRRSA